MTMCEKFKNNTMNYENSTQKQKEEEAKTFLDVIVMSAAERVSRTSSSRQFCFSAPKTIDFATVAEMLANETYGFEVKAYEKDRQILIQW
jgi:hypothetical protein